MTTMTVPSPHGGLMRAASLVAALAATVLMAAACGGSNSTASDAAPTNLATTLALFTQCMHNHGQPGFYFTHLTTLPDPGTYGLVFHGYAAQGIDAASPQARSALGTCQGLVHLGTPPDAADLHQQLVQSLKTAQCMRDHGYPDWPDPKASDGPVANGIPAGIDASSPQFQAAAKACGAPLARP
jgi:hypothetical protein